MLLRGRSKERTSPRKVTPPSPAYMNNEQFSSYLASLRDTRNTRPGGARPQPTTRRESERVAPSRPSIGGISVQSDAASSHQRTQSDTATPQITSAIRPSYGGSFASSIASRFTTLSSAPGRDYYPEKPTAPPLKPGEFVPSARYIERGSRWMEKEEAVSLRTAMEDMELKDKREGMGKATPEDPEEARLYEAALNEAAELVWQHEHGVKPPEPGTPYRYKPHLRKDSYAHARTASVGRYGDDIVPTGLARDGARSASASSCGSDGRRSLDSTRPSLDGQRKTSVESSTSKSYGSLNGIASRPTGSRRRSSMKRNISGEVQKPFSGDQIYEEPEGDTPKSKSTSFLPTNTDKVQPLKLKLKNPLNKISFAPESGSDSGRESPDVAPPSPAKRLSRYEIHKNPPTQTRNPNYTVSNPAPKPMGPRANADIPKKHGVEIRSEDIRKATSFKLGDRSKKLPTPSAVSDRPGRPIVSFDANWKAPEEAVTDSKPEPKEPNRFVGFRQSQPKDGQPQPQSKPRSEQGSSQQPPVPTLSFTPDSQITSPSKHRPSASTTPSVPSIQIDVPASVGSKPPVPAFSGSSDDGPSIPSIVLPGEDSGPSIPSIVLPGEDNGPSIPVIVTPDDNGASKAPKPSARPLPTPKKTSPFARNARNGTRPGSHWSPDPGAISRRATAVCHECSFPIEGRFVALRGASERFHPQCFACYTCGTSLEALEISPEPDNFRAERLDRIARRAAGEALEETPGKTVADDGDARLRFYCHLDWHELFAPRCKTCTTPILGDHIVALGHHYHYGHFFCAECGDPFEQGMTHIEKDGYAWCVNCQTKRTERRAPKCKRCKKPVIGQYIQALGGEWHDECFRCATCGGGFDDGQIFPVIDRVLCTGCRMRELKA